MKLFGKRISWKIRNKKNNCKEISIILSQNIKVELWTNKH